MSSFVDTNILIAYAFFLDPFNKKSNIIFSEYSNIFYSKTVKKEFKKVFRNKLSNLNEFYIGFKNYLLSTPISVVSKEVFKDYINSSDLNNRVYNSSNGSIDLFWERYLGVDYSQISDVIKAIDSCIADLSYISRNNKENLENDYLKLTTLRVEKYNSLKESLKSFGVHFPDFEIILDAHDFNIKSNFDLDFITFDDKCYDGVKSIDEFSFNQVKSRHNY